MRTPFDSWYLYVIADQASSAIVASLAYPFVVSSIELLNSSGKDVSVCATATRPGWSTKVAYKLLQES